MRYRYRVERLVYSQRTQKIQSFHHDLSRWQSEKLTKKKTPLPEILPSGNKGRNFWVFPSLSLSSSKRHQF